MKIFYIFITLSFLILSGCSSESTIIRTYKTIYEPVKENNLSFYYVGGFPIASYSTDKYSLLMSLQPAKILDETYVKLWLLYKNTSGEEYLLEPTKITGITFWEGARKKYTVNPESPLKLLGMVEEAKQQEIIVQTIGYALKTLSANTSKEIRDNTKDYESSSSSILKWYNLYTESINNGLLRKNTLFQDNSVNGFIYFKYPEEIPENVTVHGQTYNNDNSVTPYDYEIKLKLKTNDGEKEFRFKPVAGE